eukprot:jgi/Tetstr1/442541/TSEL_030639.t1
MPIIDQWQKDTQRYQQQTLRFDPASGRIRVPSRKDADAFHEFRYRRYVELFATKFNEAPKMRTRYDAYSREGFRETPASLAMTLRELKAHLPDLTWDKVNQKAFDVMTAVWRSIPALKQSLDVGFPQLKDIVVLRQSHEDRLDEIAAEVERYEDIVRKDEIRMAEALTAAQNFAELIGASALAAGGGRQHGTNTQEPVITWTMVNARCVRAQLVVVKDTHHIRPLCEACTKARGRDIFHGANYRECANKFGCLNHASLVAAVEAAEAQADVSVAVMAVDAAMEAHPEADEDRAGTLDLEAMFSRILEKSQAAHSATGAMRLAVEVPDPFLDCVDTDDYGTLLHGASCVELPMRSARNPELRMRQPGWDAQREQLTKQRPQGFEPAVEQEAPASYEGRRGGGAITSDMLDIRNQHSCSTCARRYDTPSSLVYPLL